MYDIPKVLVNFDFRYNPDIWFRSEYHCPVSYIDILADHGVMPIAALPFNENKRVRDKLVEMADGFLFIGGADYPSDIFHYQHSDTEKPMSLRRAQNDLALFNAAWITNKPILGICAGMQLACLAQGGKLIPNLEGEHQFHKAASLGVDSMHKVTIPPGRLASILGTNELEVNSAHHQAVDESSVSDQMIIAAKAADGIVEALERRNRGFGLFVQWHPERHPDPEHRKKVFKPFLTSTKLAFDRRVPAE